MAGGLSHHSLTISVTKWISTCIFFSGKPLKLPALGIAFLGTIVFDTINQTDRRQTSWRVEWLYYLGPALSTMILKLLRIESQVGLSTSLAVAGFVLQLFYPQERQFWSNWGEIPCRSQFFSKAMSFAVMLDMRQSDKAPHSPCLYFTWE